MKTNLYFLSICVVFALVVFDSCDSCDCPEPNEPMISQYDLDKSIVEVNTTNASTAFETVFQNISDSTERATMCQVFVNDARFYNDKSGYFFIETLNDAWVVAHINPDIIGTSRIDIQDVNGKYFIREMVETVKYSGYGYIEYYRTNPSTNADERKMSFVTSIRSANWFIGAGFYGGPSETYYLRDEAKQIVLKEVTVTMADGIGGIIENLYTDEQEIISFCQDFVDHIRFFDDGSGYFFINTLEGINIAHGANPDLQGTDVLGIQDTKGAFITQDMIDIVNESGFGYYNYYWDNPASGNNEQKTSFVMLIPGTNYYIGAGYYLN